LRFNTALILSLSYDNGNLNQAVVTAIARELAGFIWCGRVLYVGSASN
jgi:hypothetical protein